MADIISYGTAHGIYPWNTPRKTSTKVFHETDLYYGCDRSDRIKTCLNCSMDECINCFDKSAHQKKNDYIKRTARNQKLNTLLLTFRELYNQNLSYAEIAKQMCISRSTYQKYKAHIIAERKAVEEVKRK